MSSATGRKFQSPSSKTRETFPTSHSRCRRRSTSVAACIEEKYVQVLVYICIGTYESRSRFSFFSIFSFHILFTYFSILEPSSEKLNLQNYGLLIFDRN